MDVPIHREGRVMEWIQHLIVALQELVNEDHQGAPTGACPGRGE